MSVIDDAPYIYTDIDEIVYCDLTGEPFQQEEECYYFGEEVIKADEYMKVVSDEEQVALYEYNDEAFYYTDVYYDNPVPFSEREAAELDRMPPTITVNEIRHTVDEIMKIIAEESE